MRKKMLSTEFIFTFFNSGVLVLLLNLNLKGTGVKIKYFDGAYSDLNIYWYIYVAP
jgi:hypothetical protein